MIKLPHDVIGKAVADSDFRHRLFGDPRATLADEGVEVDEATLQGLEALDIEVVEKMLADAGGALGAAAAAAAA